MTTEILSILVSLLGIGIAIFAMSKAHSAKEAVNEVVQKHGDQKCRDDVRDLLKTLKQAREAALAHRGSPSRAVTAGRKADQDVHALRLAQDALATTAIGDELEQRLRNSATELDQALDAIDKNNPTGWVNALNVIQSVTPHIENLQIDLGKKVLSL